MQPLARLAGILRDVPARAGAARFGRAAAFLPEAIDQDGRNGKLLDQARALFTVVDPFGEFRILVAERERLDRKDPVARILRIVERLPFIVAQLVVLVAFIALGALAVIRFRPATSASA